MHMYGSADVKTAGWHALVLQAASLHVHMNWLHGSQLLAALRSAICRSTQIRPVDDNMRSSAHALCRRHDTCWRHCTLACCT